MQLVRNFSFLITLLLVTAPAAAQNLSFTSNARTFETQTTSLLSKSLAHACLTIHTPDGLPCSPSLTTFNKHSGLYLQGMVSNGYTTIKHVRQLLDNNITESLVNDLFGKNNVLQLEANTEITLLSKHFNARYTPLALRSFAVVRNEANPDLQVYAVQESGFTFQSSFETIENLYVGAQLRLLDRKFIRQRLKLVDLGTDAGKNLLKSKKQKATYIEPGATYVLGGSWKPKVSVFVANLGFYSEEYPEIETPVDVQGGISISPPVAWGDLQLALEYRSMDYQEDSLERLRLGVMYTLGAMHLAGGLDANGISGGIYYALEKLNAGILYSTTRIMNDDDYYTQTVYVQLGWQI